MSDESPILMMLAAWPLQGSLRIEQLGGGFNSHTWRITCDSGRFVAKLAPHSPTFEAGLAVAEYLEQLGFRAGGPLRTSAGALTICLGDQMLALLRFVPGAPLDPSRRQDIYIWGQAMAQVHTLLRQIPDVPAGLPRWPWAWLDPTVDHLDVAAWVRPAVVSVLEELRRIEATRPLTLGVVHGDGASVLLDPATGARAVIDWGAAMWGPLLYDVASARWLFQFQHGHNPHDFGPFLAAYRGQAPLPAGELDALDLFVRLRCVVQAFYFSWRIANDIRTGLADSSANQRGLDQARQAWEQLSAVTSFEF
ncbi:MAG: phosphotransferase enzyme family protein [Roseiflexaceae bacterium]